MPAAAQATLRTCASTADQPLFQTAMIPRTIIAFLLIALAVPAARADEVADLLAAVAKVRVTGEGSAEARAAAERLGRLGPDALPRLLSAMDGANVVAVNWYRTAYEQIVARELARPQPQLPIADLQNYVKDSRHNGRARRLVLELLDRQTPDFGRELLPRLLDDPEFRGDAVDLALAAGDKAKAVADKSTSGLRLDARRAAVEAYRRAFRHARDSSQVIRAAQSLRSLGETVSIIDHLGLVTDWYLVGPFDAPEFTGFDKVFPPEEKPGEPIDPKATFTGKAGKPIGWRRHETTDTLGQLNLIQAIASVKEAVGYAYTEVESPREQRVDLRCGADDNLTVWLNGQRVFARRQWLNGTRLDRFIAPVTLRQGKNILLVKICQGPQHKNPDVPNNWSLQLRLCDTEGAGVGVKGALPKAAKDRN